MIVTHSALVKLEQALADTSGVYVDAGVDAQAAKTWMIYPSCKDGIYLEQEGTIPFDFVQ